MKTLKDNWPVLYLALQPLYCRGARISEVNILKRRSLDRINFNHAMCPQMSNRRSGKLDGLRTWVFVQITVNDLDEQTKIRTLRQDVTNVLSSGSAASWEELLLLLLLLLSLLLLLLFFFIF